MKKIKEIINYFFIGFSFLTSKKIFAILTVVMFISLVEVSTGYREELILKEQEMIYESVPSEVKYYSSDMEKSFSKDTAIDSKFDCYKESVSEADVNDGVKSYIEQLKTLYNESGEHFSFLYRDLYTGFTVSYNEESPIFTASTIKAPAMIYLYELASKGQIDLNEKLQYTSNFYSGGSGRLKNKPVNTFYTVGELIEYSIHDSDNIAYAMLMNRFKRSNVLSFWQSLGTSHIFTLNTIWGVTSARDASIYMLELYRFYLENKEYGGKLFDYFKNAEWKLITNKEGQAVTANKGGWSDKAIHDVAIVFDENPYLLVIMSNLGEGNYPYLFNNTSKIVGQLHEEYWKFKENKCNTIKQY